MPEVRRSEELRRAGVDDVGVRRFLTFTAAMDRSRDADVLWEASAALYEREPWVYEPREIASRPLRDLRRLLKESKVSQRHEADSNAWATIGRTLSNARTAPAVSTAVTVGIGDAGTLLAELQRTVGGRPLFPILKGPKIGPMWVRMLTCPGGANVSSLETIPVAVDVHVRKTTEYLGVLKTRGERLEDIRARIQHAWAENVRKGGAEGPGVLADTPSAVDPALWFFGKWGCSHCEDCRRRVPVADVCDGCRFDSLNPGGVVARRLGKTCGR